MDDSTRQVKLEIFAPPEVLEKLQAALAEVGAGRIGNYDHCMFVSRGTGYWRPLPGANPYHGQVGWIESAAEIKIEVNCPLDLVPAALAAIRRVHPYEEPLINCVPLLNPEGKEESKP